MSQLNQLSGDVTSTLSPSDYKNLVGLPVSSHDHQTQRIIQLTNVVSNICKEFDLTERIETHATQIMEGEFTKKPRSKKTHSGHAIALESVIRAARSAGVYVDVEDAIELLKLRCGRKQLERNLSIKQTSEMNIFNDLTSMYVNYYVSRWLYEYPLTPRQHVKAQYFAKQFVENFLQVTTRKIIVAIAVYQSLVHYPYRDTIHVTLRDLCKSLQIPYTTVRKIYYKFCSKMSYRPGDLVEGQSFQVKHAQTEHRGRALKNPTVNISGTSHLFQVHELHGCILCDNVTIGDTTYDKVIVLITKAKCNFSNLGVKFTHVNHGLDTHAQSLIPVADLGEYKYFMYCECEKWEFQKKWTEQYKRFSFTSQMGLFVKQLGIDNDQYYTKNIKGSIIY